MIQSRFAIILYLNCIIKVFGYQKMISTSFTGSTFSDPDNWVVIGAQPQITQCSSKTLFGGYNVFADTTVTKTFALPPHYQLKLVLQFCNIDSWNKQKFMVYFDQDMSYSVQVAPSQQNSMCGNDQVGDSCFSLQAVRTHSSPTAVILLMTDIKQPASYQSWGIRDVYIYVETCPDGCLLCKATDLTIQCLGWQVFFSGWAQLNINELSSEGWNINQGIAEATQCGSTALFGGSNKLGKNTVLSQSFFNIPKHFKLKIQFLWARIENWDSKVASMVVNGAKVWEKTFYSDDGYPSYVCGETGQKLILTLFYRVEVELDHTSSQLNVTFTTTLSSTVYSQSFGIRDFVIYTRDCPQGTYWTGVTDFICQYCYKSCYKCNGPNSEDCTDCGDPMIQKKQLVAGQCICIPKTVDQDKSDGTTSCETCHPKCEKCYKPFDIHNFQLFWYQYVIRLQSLKNQSKTQCINNKFNQRILIDCNTDNQYCTMCLQGQNRVVSDQFMCVCRTGYGDDGISEVCFKCHYSCEHCNGFLANNCTTCSSSSNRILTSDSQCQCKLGYFDTGINDMFCKQICHNTCSSCTLPGVDQCTSCPVTRKPDQIGTVFQCLCKNSHQYSDDTKLECQDCHFTCLTCNGGQDSIAEIMKIQNLYNTVNFKKCTIYF